jgi:hypothetical protein
MMTLYTEAWKQYVHEDQLTHSRMTIYFSVLGGMTAILAASASSIVKIGMISLSLSKVNPAWADRDVNFGFFLFGCFALMLGWLSCRVCRMWTHAIKASRQYVNLRWMTAFAVENILGSFGVAQAQLEDKWRHSPSFKAKFSPFSADNPFGIPHDKFLELRCSLDFSICSSSLLERGRGSRDLSFFSDC